MNADQIKHMVNRFLGWRLPEDFNPDGGISVKKTFNDHLPTPSRYEPTGTNLFDASQAHVMVRYMVEGMPETPQLPAIDLAEQKHLLSAAASEIESLRRVNEVLAAKVETMELFGVALRTRPDYGSVGMTEDVVWRMRRQIEEIDHVQVMRAS